MDEKSLNRPEGHGSSNSRRKSREGTYETDYNFDSSNDYVVPKSTKYRYYHELTIFIGENSQEIFVITGIHLNTLVRKKLKLF